MLGTGHKSLPSRGLTYISRFERTARRLEFVGSLPVEDRPSVERAYVRARTKLENYINALEKEYREKVSDS